MNNKYDLKIFSSKIYDEMSKTYLSSIYNVMIQKKDKSIRDIIITLDYLQISLIYNSPVLFHDYLHWLNSVLNKMGLDVENFIEMMSIYTSVLSKELKDIQWEVYFPSDKEFYQSKVEEVSLISQKNPFHKEAMKYLNYLLTTQRIQARDYILNLSNSVSLEDIYLKIFQPVQREIGRLWQLNRISVALEHYSTAVTQQIMSELYSKIVSKNRIGKKLISASVGTELHELGIKMVTDIFELHGWDTIFLGANTPRNSIASIMEEISPDVVGLSATMIYHIHVIQGIINQLNESNIERKFKIMVGGYPFILDNELWKKVGADFYANNAIEAVEKANKMVGL